MHNGNTSSRATSSNATTASAFCSAEAINHALDDVLCALMPMIESPKRNDEGLIATKGCAHRTAWPKPSNWRWRV